MISIGLPTYNGAHRIMKAINSILAQHYPNLELIIADNCSTDNTRQVVEALIPERPWIRYVRHEKNLGILANFEFTLDAAGGKYFMWVSDDDLLEPGALFKYVDFLERNEEYILVSGRILYWRDSEYLFDEQFSLEQEKPMSRVISYYSQVRWTGMGHGMMRREKVQKIPTRKVFGSDYHFIATAAYLGKMKSFDFVGYNKWLGGSSDHMKKNARSLDKKKWAATFPRFKLAYDAFFEPRRSPVYSHLTSFSKFALGVRSAAGVVYNYYPKLYSEVLIRKMKKLFTRRQGSTAG